MMKIGQTYFKKFVLSTPQNFCSMFDHFLILCMKALSNEILRFIIFQIKKLCNKKPNANFRLPKII